MRKTYSSLHQWAQDADAALRSLVEKNHNNKLENNITAEAKIIQIILQQVETELLRALHKFPAPLKNAHEGYAVLKEEVDELWEEIKHGQDKSLMGAEAVQVAAMAVRFIKELTL